MLNECKSCIPGFILEGTSCANCGDNCANCDGNKAVCRLCKRNFFLKDGACTTCVDNTIEQCECNEAVNCATCETADTKKCENCLTGYKKSDEGSCDECSEGFFMSQNLCSKCGDVCKSCSGDGERCDTCTTGYTMSINQICEKDCTDAVTDGMVCVGDQIVACGSDSQTVACKCESAVNCLKCNGTDSKKCQSCMPGYKLAGDVCTGCADGAEVVGAFCFISGNKSKNNLSGGAIAGIVIAVLIVAGAIGGGVFWFMRQKKKTSVSVEGSAGIQE
ncbi:Cysteine-rich membrane protein 2 [Spironucleus salmonicida]|uniref:Cysteine-rich membrane protein 2 n=1 Tax=Spironucleus salmonicida TaxID=348837 RepID=V6LXI3_9EUKA|nr:Cysteine-rich membrane protein 2 [Spironucleus salmonicida]|eukprot:EST45529.1 Cysteine-rich membrane protein 2 [Spironucleus salmonicida]